MKAAGCLWGQVKLFYCRTIFVDKTTIHAVTASYFTTADKPSAKTYNAIRNFATQFGLCTLKAALPSEA
ncbi:hypothetical protein BGP83_12380 [Pseudomonas putida]|nr:hypothetical protein BGP83_12380 [Pseudomonas putida]